MNYQNKAIYQNLLLKVLKEDYSRIVRDGVFGEHMLVNLQIDGPVTIFYDTRGK